MLDFRDEGPSASGDWSCIHKDTCINIYGQEQARGFGPVCVCCQARPHLEFQCIEGVFGVAAESPLGEHLHWVEQLIALGHHRTSHL